MKSLFNSAENNEIVDRINRLNPHTKALWGKMTVSQMLAHCQQPMRVAFGETTPKRTLVGFLFGAIAKKQLVGDTPFKKNLPTDKSFVVADTRDFQKEKQLLIEWVKKFRADGPEGLTKEPHPFFGKMTTEEWDRLTWKHLDHHLQQFGV